MRKGREEILRKQIHTEKQNARRSMSTGILNGRAENGTRTRDPQLGKFIVKTMKITIQQQYTISMFQKFVNYTSTTVKNYCFYDVNLTKIRKIYIYQDIKSYCTPNPMYGFIPCGVRAYPALTPIPQRLGLPGTSTRWTTVFVTVCVLRKMSSVSSDARNPDTTAR